ncbi:hypothetical protein OG879_27770 [Streptomyces caniferus]|uniref:hypothetical protein n=1 Tax=Streptomyces caniferus TaxID=285557 RepID=UPI002E2C6EB6|nr:hypothetical protein [Streptomyces caniferus]
MARLGSDVDINVNVNVNVSRSVECHGSQPRDPLHARGARLRHPGCPTLAA